MSQYKSTKILNSVWFPHLDCPRYDSIHKSPRDYFERIWIENASPIQLMYTQECEVFSGYWTMKRRLNRRQFIKATTAMSLASMSGNVSAKELPPEGMNRTDLPAPKAKSLILIWLPGGVSQCETWDPKPHTPFRKGMKGSEFKSSTPSIPTSVDGIEFSAGLEEMASVMHHGTLVRSLNDVDPGSPSHPKYIYQVHTGYKFPAGFNAPSMGSIISRNIGPLNPNIPAYIDIGRDPNDPKTENQFLNVVCGPGFYGHDYSPFVIERPMDGMKTLQKLDGMTDERLDARLRYQQKLNSKLPSRLRDNDTIQRYMKSMLDARNLMDSPAKKAFRFMEEEPESIIDGYGLKDDWLPNDDNFRSGCILARRLVEQGARFVEVEYPFTAFGFFDVHKDGATKMHELRKYIDKPIAQLIRDLDERGLLDTTMVVVMSEFGRTLAGFSDGVNFTRDLNESIDSPAARGENIVFENTDMYGYHGHLRSWSALMYGAGIQRGKLFGKTADEHPMIAIEDPVTISDVHATMYHQLGLPPDLYYVTQGRPVYITNNGEGKPIQQIMA